MYLAPERDTPSYATGAQDLYAIRYSLFNGVSSVQRLASSNHTWNSFTLMVYRWLSFCMVRVEQDAPCRIVSTSRHFYPVLA